MLQTLAVSGYRSLRDLILPLAPLTVVTGANGTGKSSLYRSLRLLSEVAQGQAIGSLAAEGGLSSTLWAGPETLSRGMKTGEVAITSTVRDKPVALKLGFASEDFGYAVDLGLPVMGSAFANDPEIKAEAVWVGDALRPHNVLAVRRGPHVQARLGASLETLSTTLPVFDSMMTHAADPRNTPEMLELRDRMRNWRFYDQLRTDRDAPARQHRVGTRTPVLAGDGGDLAAAVATIQEIGDAAGMNLAVADAFPRSRIAVVERGDLLGLEMHQHGLLRPLSMAEVSDGTLRYLLLCAALMTPRPPGLMVLNEPETSLHTDLIPPLGRLIAQAAAHSQIIVVTHSKPLTDALREDGGLIHWLLKDTGETVVPDADYAEWEWPRR